MTSELRDASRALMQQLSINKFVDPLGHDINMLKAVGDMKKALDADACWPNNCPDKDMCETAMGCLELKREPK